MLFIKSELGKKNAENASFMVHCVTPNCVSHGIILDNNAENLMYCRKINEEKDEYAWLVGDSANAYPPGYALVLGLKDAFFLVKRFLKVNYRDVSEFNELPDIPLNYNLFECDNTTGKYTEKLLTSPKTCEYVKNLNFVDGYQNNSVENDKLKNMTKIMTIINSKTCVNLETIPNQNVNDMLVNMYNLYQLNNFFHNIITIFCNESTGGRRLKRRNYKRKTKRKRNNKRKTNKSKINKRKKR
jgi:hypothetical protein